MDKWDRRVVVTKLGEHRKMLKELQWLLDRLMEIVLEEK